VTIGRGLLVLDIFAFDQSFELLTIAIDSENSSCSDIDGVLFTKDQTTLLLYPRGRLGSYTIPNATRTIGRAAFHNTRGLTSITVPSGVTNISEFAFYLCPNLATVYFRGDRPTNGRDTFSFGSSVVTFHLPQTTGWDSTFGGRPAILWNPTAITNADFGIRGASFGFNISGPADLVIIVEACDNLANPQWTPVSTNTLTAGTASFNDASWRNHPARIYRFRSP
jgi:hypothetical protein